MTNSLCRKSKQTEVFVKTQADEMILQDTTF